MKFNVAKSFVDVHGRAVTENGIPVTFGTMIALCILNTYPQRDQEAKSEEKLLRYRIAQLVANPPDDGLVSLTAKEIVLIQELAALGLSINAFGALTDFLENPEEKEGKVSKIAANA